MKQMTAEKLQKMQLKREKEIQKWYADEKLPCKDRREGKKRFEELKAGLF